jgi:Pyruvate phosphate dikinase, PEP/pyruvate binding domain.
LPPRFNFTRKIFWHLSSGNRQKIRAPFFFSGIHIRHRHLFDLSKKLLTFMEQKVGMPVDIEFTYETEPREFNLLQMRPLAAFEECSVLKSPKSADEKSFLKRIGWSATAGWNT